MKTINEIVESAARTFRVPVGKISARGHRRPIREVRYAICYVARKQGHRYQDICVVVGRTKNRVYDGAETCADLMSVDPVYKADVMAMF